MGDGDASQRERLAAAAEFDYDGDPRWAEYWSNALLPPDLASRPDVVARYKLKFYQRFIDPNLSVENTSSSISSQSSGASVRPSTASVTDRLRHQNSGHGSSSSLPPRRNPQPLQLDRRTIHFSINAWVLIMVMVGMLPLIPERLSNKAYRLSILGTTASSLYSLYTLYGIPRAWTLSAFHVWFESIFTAKDFIRFIYCLVFITSKMQSKLALIPVFCRAVELVAKFLKLNFTYSSIYRYYFAKPCVWVEGNTSTLLTLSSNAEVALGFLLIVSLFSWSRNVLQFVMYWQLLKLMYHAPATAGSHRDVWLKIGQSVAPYINFYIPLLNSAAIYVQRWWIR